MLSHDDLCRVGRDGEEEGECVRWRRDRGGRGRDDSGGKWWK